ncbi:MAG: hypothetical protein JWQ40_540 [Segetibacter sp.]|jgi:hypothetical protein|nr:hypothetical protein [Segetibacter sp.]
MYTYKQIKVLEHIEEIISSSRSGDELFFTDYRKAAKDILSFLESENMVVKKEVALEIVYNEQSDAA